MCTYIAFPGKPEKRLSKLIVVIDTKNLAMFQNTLELDGTHDCFGLIGGFDSVSVFTTIMSVDRFYYHYGNLDDFKKQFPDWEQFMSEHDIAYFSKEKVGGFLVAKGEVK